MSPGFGRCAFVLCQSSGIRLICSEVRLRVFSNGELSGTADQLEGGTERPTLSTFRNLQCSAWSPRISCNKPLDRRFRLGRVLFWSLLRPCRQQPPSEGNNPSLTGSDRQSVERSVARGAEAFSCTKDGNDR